MPRVSGQFRRLASSPIHSLLLSCPLLSSPRSRRNTHPVLHVEEDVPPPPSLHFTSLPAQRSRCRAARSRSRNEIYLVKPLTGLKSRDAVALASSLYLHAVVCPPASSAGRPGVCVSRACLSDAAAICNSGPSQDSDSL